MMLGWFTKDKDALIAKLFKERDELAKTVPSLLGQIQEQKAIVEYTLHDKEQEIEKLKSERDKHWESLTQERDQVNKHAAARLKEIEKLKSELATAWETSQANYDQWQLKELKVDELKDQLSKIMSDIGNSIQNSGLITFAEQDKEIEKLKKEVADLTKRNEELEAWGKRLAVEATQELTGNKRKSFDTALSKKQLKSMREAWEDGELSKMKVVKKGK